MSGYWKQQHDYWASDQDYGDSFSENIPSRDYVNKSMAQSNDASEPVDLRFSELLHTTQKAYLIRFDEREIWMPISQCKIYRSLNGDYITIPWWLLDQNSLYDFCIESKETKQPKKTLRQKLGGS